ncbi:ANK-REP-REGION domain-containing protein [Mycena sanguinolenta]|uniref:ANK-REP-REGION domain-containing protein n=1 Tax=Mycena sanguinolenta TaxID=230812 RepID=A0A8H6YQF8_9AGAR|nr:ANK-REP-REGION domain-containing protein [Mycena sanguinolenta]
MADLVGLVASVLQLIDTVAKARDYIRDFREAPKDQHRLLQELDALKPLIRKLDTLAKQSNTGGGCTSEMLQEWEEPLEQLETTMRRLARKANLTGIQQFSNRLTWAMWGKDDVQQALNAVERYKSLVNIWLTLDTWTLDLSTSISKAAHDNSADHENIIATLTQTIEATAEDHQIHQNYISQSVRTVPGTGGWLLQDPVFKKWELGTTGTVWCRGIPGAGKTILSAMVVDHLWKSLDSENTRVAVIFLNHKETEAQSPTNVLAAIWRQLIFEQPLSPAVEGLYLKHQEKRTRPSLEDIHSTLCSTASAFSHVFIVVDALDEYPEDLRNVLLHRLSLLGPSVSLMLTSRPHIDIKFAISNFEIIEIRAAEHDIREYLEGQIRKSQRLSRHVRSAPDIRQALETSIVEGSDGMFLLAKLHIDSLLTKHTVKAVREALKSMPGDLDGTYTEVVARINDQTPEDKALAWLILSWMTHTKRPLRPAELREALAVESGAAELDPENFLDMDSILSVCAGLVVIHEEDDIIGLVHYTVEKYLERLATVQFPHASTEITMTCITYLSFEGFLDKLNRDNPLTLFKNHAFLDYAAEYCFVHARGDPEEQIRDEILAFLGNCSFWRELWNRTKFPPISETRLWIAATFRLENLCRHLIKEDGPGAVLLEAASKGRTSVVQILIPSTSRSEHGHALVAAARRGHDEIIQLLLEHGTDIHFRGRDGTTALQSASFHGCKRALRLLIENGADVDMAGSQYGTPLCAASFRGHYDIVVLLLEHGADIEVHGGPIGTALQAAFVAGRDAIVRLLLRNGADDPDTLMRGLMQNALSAMNEAGVADLMDELNQRNELDAMWLSAVFKAASPEEKQILVRSLIYLGPHIVLKQQKSVLTEILQVISQRADSAEMIQLVLAHGADPNAEGTGGSILQRVSAAGHREIVKILLEHGADVNAVVASGPSALISALTAGHAEIARSLIQHGAEMNALDEVLERASAAGHAEAVKILIEHGADVNSAGALWKASTAGHVEVIKLLIEHGADVNREEALRIASAAGHAEAVTILVEHGVDVNAADDIGGSALEQASEAGHERIIKILIEHGAEVNAGSSFRGPLQRASAAGHMKVVKLLIEHGADINASDVHCWSSLQMASAAGHKKIVEILLEHGADVHAVGPEGTAWKHAMERGHEEVVKMLIEHGADVNASDPDDMNALQRASVIGHEKIVKMLIEHGADVDASSHRGSALQLVSAVGHEKIVEILIEHGANVNASSNRGTALQWASAMGQEKVVKNTPQAWGRHTCKRNSLCERFAVGVRNGP